jgi:hypothetical protein
MDVTPLGTTNVPDAEKNWLRVLPSKAKAKSIDDVTDAIETQEVPLLVSTFPADPGAIS